MSLKKKKKINNCSVAGVQPSLVHLARDANDGRLGIIPAPEFTPPNPAGILPLSVPLSAYNPLWSIHLWELLKSNRNTYRIKARVGT